MRLNFCLFYLGLLYFGDKPYKNQLVYKGFGGSGGGAIQIESLHVEIDGELKVDGEDADRIHGIGAGKINLLFSMFIYDTAK